MNCKLKRPFRAPRTTADRSKGGKEANQLDAAIEQSPLAGVQRESEEATALRLGWKPLIVKETQ